MFAAHSQPEIHTLIDPVVSPRSAFSDDTWHFDTALPGKPYTTVRWKMQLSNGSYLTDPQNAAFLFACKHLLSHIVKGTIGLGKQLRARSIMSRAELLRYYILLMSAHGIYRFADLTDAHIIAFRNGLASNQVKKRRGDGTFRQTSKIWSAAYRRQAALMLRTIVNLQPLIPGGATLSKDLTDNLLGATDVPRRGPGLTPRIPDEIFVKLLSTAITWVEDVGPRLLSRSSELIAIKSTSRSTAVIGRRYAEYYKASKPMIVYVSGTEYDIGSIKRIPLRVWLNHLMAASYIIIAGMTGMRMCEVLSLRPGCLEPISSPDGRTLLRIIGMLYKTSKNEAGELASWIAGWDSPDNPIRLAVRTLEELHSRHGSLDPDILLFTPIPEFRGGRNKGKGRSGHGLSTRLNAFAKFNRIHDWKFATHQFRKTFARFVTLAAPTGVLALQRHFKHVSVAMTERYIPSDSDLMDEIIQQSFESDVERLDAILGADRLAGMRGEEILKRNLELRGDSAEAVEARRACIESTVNDSSFRMVRHVYGDCFYEASSARCSGNVVNVGLQTCIACKNFSVDRSHLGFWQAQRDALDSDLAEISNRGKRSEALEAQRDAAAKIIGKLTDG